MSSIIHRLAGGADFMLASAAPVETDGGKPRPRYLVGDKLDQLVQYLSNPPAQLDSLPAYLDAVKHLHSGLDDRKLLLEHLLTLMARLGGGNEFSSKLQEAVIDLLYKDIPHPPACYLSVLHQAGIKLAEPLANVSYAYRSADGSYYNPLFPTLGMAGTPYARSVPSTLCTPLNNLPDAGLVFDTLLRRKEGTFKPHEGGMSSLFFAMADLIIHCIFDTDHQDVTKNNVSSYLDLSVLYGSSEAQMDSVRRFDGTGRLWDDVFADRRLMLMPPSACALLVLFCRNHNRIAQRILDINEKGKYKAPALLSEEARRKQDDEIFHRARLVNCGFFMQVILADYVGAILGLVRDGLTWRLDPLMTMRRSDHEFSPQGQGNVVSIEFNLLYRWHAALSAQDTKWTEALFRSVMGQNDFDKVTPADFKRKVGQLFHKPHDVRTATFGDYSGKTLERHAADDEGMPSADGAGRFADAELARILQDATNWRAGSYGARCIPAALRVIEVMGIEQSREWGACSMNEFRHFMGLKPYESFKEWNPDPVVHEQAETLYKDINNLELHVGMQAEAIKTPGPGAGLCPGYTISRAILGDAVALTRGDRFLTTEMTPSNLSRWGYKYSHVDPEDGSVGGILTRMLFSTLPDHYPPRSAYTHFPFLDPEYMKKEMKQRGDKNFDRYTWERPAPPSPLIVLKTWDEAVDVLQTQRSRFASSYTERLKDVTGREADEQILVRKTLLRKADLWPSYFATKTMELINASPVTYVDADTKTVDLGRNVINLLPVHWIAQELGSIALKTTSNPLGTEYESEMYDMFEAVCRYVYLDNDTYNHFKLQTEAMKAFDRIAPYASRKLSAMSGSRISVQGITQTLSRFVLKGDDSSTFLRTLLEASEDRDSEALAEQLFSEVVPTAAHFSRIVVQVVDFFLGCEGQETDSSRAKKEVRERIAMLAAQGSYKADKEIMKYVDEALRLEPAVSGVYRIASSTTVVGNKRIEAGSRVYVALSAAKQDPMVFGDNAATPDFERHTPLSTRLGLPETGLLAPGLFEKILPRVLGVIFSLKNLRRAPGQSGKMSSFTQSLHGAPEKLFLDFSGNLTPLPESLFIEYDF
ncbi:heme peroxidase [Schizophyllum amplum]|uniref:Heme peroxidase n=1 Tax=Schizophyllum amplum TaxID=97359 RepID=A0A550C2V9_9AGAR|nr:heme peroxidase [Auriculariopsis ampla]